MNTNFENARDLNTVILPDRVRFLHLQTASTFSIFSIVSKKFFFLENEAIVSKINS